jgi:hypothetical protein
MYMPWFMAHESAIGISIGCAGCVWCRRCGRHGRLGSERASDLESGQHDKFLESQAVALDDLNDLTMDPDEVEGIEMTPMIGSADAHGIADSSSRSRISAKLAAAGAKIAGAKGAIAGAARKGSKYDRLTDLEAYDERTDEKETLVCSQFVAALASIYGIM